MAFLGADRLRDRASAAAALLEACPHGREPGRNPAARDGSRTANGRRSPPLGRWRPVLRVRAPDRS
eukprot:8759800-Alexandrium_andersonii.AAC.1